MTHNREYNQAKMIQFFQNGCKAASQPLQFGLELEHFVVHNESGRSLPYKGEHGIEALMNELKILYSDFFYEQGHLIGLSRRDLTVSLEPAAQLEISIAFQPEALAKAHDSSRAGICLLCQLPRRKLRQLLVIREYILDDELLCGGKALLLLHHFQ